jgi:hypothetical protein
MTDPGQIHRGLHLTDPLTHGEDVKALQYAVNKVNDDKGGYWHVQRDGSYGPHTARGARLSAWAIGIGDSDLEELRKHGHCTEDVQGWLRHPDTRNDVQKQRAADRKGELADKIARHADLRKRIVSNARWGVDHEPNIHYRQSRPIDGIHDAFRLPLYTDCSGFATDCYSWAGAPDPNGNGFDGYGFTGTILGHCRHVPRAEAKPGDLVVFGGYPGTHVVILTEPGSHSDPKCVSHGQEAGPIEVPLSVEIRAHAGQPLTWCSALD